MAVAVWEVKKEILGVEITTGEMWEAIKIITGVEVEQEEEGWRLLTAVTDLPVDFRTEVAEWELITTILALPIEATWEVALWSVVDTVAAEVDVSDEAPPEPPPGKVSWWVWAGLAVIAVVVAIVIARRRG